MIMQVMAVTIMIVYLVITVSGRLLVLLIGWPIHHDVLKQF